MKFFLIAVLLAVSVANIYAAPVEGEEYALKDTVELAKKWGALIEKEGVKAWHFLECMGEDWAMHCADQTVGCVKAKNLEGCVELIVCEGKSAATCASSFK